MAATVFELLGLRDWRGKPRTLEIQRDSRLGPARFWKEPWFPRRNCQGKVESSAFEAGMGVREGQGMAF